LPTHLQKISKNWNEEAMKEGNVKEEKGGKKRPTKGKMEETEERKNIICGILGSHMTEPTCTGTKIFV
jgi:hypothetical protein